MDTATKIYMDYIRINSDLRKLLKRTLPLLKVAAYEYRNYDKEEMEEALELIRLIDDETMREKE